MQYKINTDMTVQYQFNEKITGKLDFYTLLYPKV